MAHLDAASLDDIAQFFSTYYTPDNAVLSITGDLDPAETQIMVERHFGAIPRGAGKPALGEMKVPATLGGSVREVVEDDVMLPRIFVAFRTPVFGSPGYYASSVTAAILGLKKGSRLQRSLVREQQIASDASAFTYDLAKASDMLVVDVTARPDITLDVLEHGIHTELDRLITDGVSEAEVARAIALVETDLVAVLQSAGDRADRLSMFATYFNDPTLVNVQTERYRAVTTQQVNAFIQEFLVESNRASLIFVPRAVADANQQEEVAMAEAP